MELKKIIIIPILFLSLSLTASTYYVSTTGSDSNPGTLASPWATWQKAFDTAEAGDTVFFRGNTWMLGPGLRVVYDPELGHGNVGTYGNWITFINYPGETPILDGTNNASDYEEILWVSNVTYAKLIGLTIRNKQQDEWEDNIRAVQITENGTIHLERLTVHDCGGYGFTINGYDTLYLINCDSYNNYNPLSDDPGNRPDGFATASGSEVGDYTYIVGCRAWNNSDDGFEISTARDYYVDQVWAFGNGYGNGEGVAIKYGTGYIENLDNRIQVNCISAYNKGPAFAHQNLLSETHGVVGRFYNNLSYRSQSGFQQALADYGYLCPVDFDSLILINNLVYHSTGTFLDQIWPYACNYGYPDYLYAYKNTFTTKLTSPFWLYNTDYGWSYDGEDAQFIALPADSADCVAILSASRQADGSLPDIGDYFHLTDASVLDSAGVDVGMSATPDIGVDWAYIDAGEPDPEQATVLTLAITDYNAVQAVVGANIISDGGGTITAKGVCYSTSENPTITDRRAILTPGTGISSLRLTTLRSGTTYHFRAYATNSVGTSYGSDVSITTPVNSKPRLTGSTLRHNGQTVIVR